MLHLPFARYQLNALKYSNLIGTELAVKALRKKKYNYDTALTLALDTKLRDLGIQSKGTEMHTSEMMRGK